MVAHKKQFLLALFFLLHSPILAEHSFIETVEEDASEISTRALRHTKCVLGAVVQSFDYLLYPALCFAIGRAVYKGYVAPRLTDAPQCVHDVERYLPGGDTARHFLAYLAVGSVVFMALNKIVTNSKTQDFMSKNMPNSFGLLKEQFLQNDLIEG